MVLVAETVGHVMRSSVRSVAPDETVGKVAEMMRTDDIGCVLVVDHGRLAGIVTDRDIVIRGLSDDEYATFLNKTPVRNVMSARDLATVASHEDVDRAAEVMATHRVRRLPVVDRGQIVGIISLGDVIQVTRCNNAARLALYAVTGK